MERVNSKDDGSCVNETRSIELHPVSNKEYHDKELKAKSFIGGVLESEYKDECSNNTIKCKATFEPMLPENVREKYGPEKEECCTEKLKNFKHLNIQLNKVPHDFSNLDKQHFQEIFKSIQSCKPENLNGETIVQFVETWLKDLLIGRKPSQEAVNKVKNALISCGNHEECQTCDIKRDNNAHFKDQNVNFKCARLELREMHRKVYSNPLPGSTVEVFVEPLWHRLVAELFETIGKLNDVVQKLSILSEWDWFCITFIAIGLYAIFVQKWIIMANQIKHLKERKYDQEVIEMVKKNTFAVTYEEFQKAQGGWKLSDEVNATVHGFAVRTTRGSKYSFGCEHTYQGDMCGLSVYFDFDTKADDELGETFMNKAAELTTYQWKWRGNVAKISLEFTKLCDKVMHYAVREAADFLCLKYPVTTPRVETRLLLTSDEKASLLAASCFANYGAICSDGQDKLHEPGCQCIEERYASWMYPELFCNLLEQWCELKELSSAFLLSKLEAQRIIYAFKEITMCDNNCEIIHESGKDVIYSLMENRHNGLELLKRSSAACDEGLCGLTRNEILDSARRVKNEAMRQKLCEYASKKGNDVGTIRLEAHRIDIAVFLRIMPQLNMSQEEWDKCCRVGVGIFENTCELVNSGEGCEKLEQAALAELVFGGCSMLENLVANQPSYITWNS